MPRHKNLCLDLQCTWTHFQSGRNLWGISRAKTPFACALVSFSKMSDIIFYFFSRDTWSVSYGYPMGIMEKKTQKSKNLLIFFCCVTTPLATGIIRIGRASCVCVCVFMHPYSKNAHSLCHYPTPPMWWSLMIILFSVPIRKSNHGNALRQKII